MLVATLAVAALAATFAPPAGASSHHHRMFRLTGTVTDQNGHAISGAAVGLFSTADAFGAALRGLGCVLSGGTDASLCSPDRLFTKTDRYGRFSLAFDPSWLIGRPGSLDILDVTGHVPSGGLHAAETTVDVTMTARDRSLGTVALWQPTVGVTHSNGQYSIHVPAPPAPATTIKAADIVDASTNVAWWLALDHNGNTTIDERIVEDGAPYLSFYAESPHIRYSAWRLRITTVGVPTSRKLGCSTYLNNGQLAPITGCPYTNGQLAQQMSFAIALKVVPHDACTTSSNCVSPNTMVLDLGQLRMLDAIVWRGCDACSVEVSLDGIDWFAWPQQKVNGSSDAVVTGTQLPVRYVRVQGDVFLFWRLRQLSVWTSPMPVIGAL